MKAETNWISVKDRLPQYDSKCLVRWEDGNYSVLFYWAVEWSDIDHRYDIEGTVIRVTHWIPIEPPEAD